jgi:ABC-type transport system involved in multi-copper enzyme maturation permease subunit
MLWVTWRQQRTQTLATAALVIAAAIALVVTGLHLADLYTSVTACRIGCDNAVDTFRNDAQSGFSGFVYHLSLYGMYVVPALIGAFWGAPLVARELESGTHRLAWNQSVSRTRWLVTKLAIGGLCAMLAVAALSLTATFTLHHLEHGKIGPVLFGARGVVPIAYTAFAYALGVAAGALLRRTVPAMAITIALYTVAVVLMPTVVRAHLLPTSTVSTEITGGRSMPLGIRLTPGGHIQVIADISVPGAWNISNVTVKPDGTEFTGPADPTVCGMNASPKSCNDWIASLHLRDVLTYQPASHYWPLQWTESGAFLAAALLLAGLAVWWTRHRIS